jgi:hypothetical protein
MSHEKHPTGFIIRFPYFTYDFASNIFLLGDDVDRDLMDVTYGAVITICILVRPAGLLLAIFD